MKSQCRTNQKLTKEFSDLAKFLRIIGDDNRLRILYLLQTGEYCVCEIFPVLDLSQNLVSSHLKVMLEFGLLQVRRDWRRNYYSLNKAAFKKFNLLLTNFFKKI